jgi:hypothetical protein
MQSTDVLSGDILRSCSMLTNELYLAVLPIIHLTDRFGLTEQVLTLFPDKTFATLFHSNEVDGYIATFQNRADTYLRGPNVLSYEVFKEPTASGMIIVKVIQHVA